MSADESTHPGTLKAVEAGCTCRGWNDVRQVYVADKDCPLHGLHLVRAELDGEPE